MKHGVAIAALLAASAIGCASTAVPATVTMAPIKRIDSATPIYINSEEQKERIAEALEANGFKTIDEPDSGAYMLNVLFGNARSSKECGKMKNVIFTLLGETSPLQHHSIVQIKARGFSGSCEPNVLDDMAAVMSWVSD